MRGACGCRAHPSEASTTRRAARRPPRLSPVFPVFGALLLARAGAAPGGTPPGFGLLRRAVACRGPCAGRAPPRGAFPGFPGGHRHALLGPCAGRASVVNTATARTHRPRSVRRQGLRPHAGDTLRSVRRLPHGARRRRCSRRRFAGMCCPAARPAPPGGMILPRLTCSDPAGYKGPHFGAAASRCTVRHGSRSPPLCFFFFFVGSSASSTGPVPPGASWMLTPATAPGGRRRPRTATRSGWW